jgi:hypothetical protein
MAVDFADPWRVSSNAESRWNQITTVAPVDTDGRQLRLRCGSPDRGATHVTVVRLDVDLPPATIRLEVLAASHRVRLRAPGRTDDGSTDDGSTGWEAEETVACAPSPPTGPSVGDALPGHHRWTAGGWELVFTSTITVGEPELRRARSTIEELAVDRAADGRVLAARFPGHPDALTALTVEAPPTGPSDRWPPTVRWQTWHLYPGHRPHLVATTTTARHHREEIRC